METAFLERERVVSAEHLSASPRLTAVDVRSFDFDQELRKRTELFIGSIAIDASVSIESVPETESLLTAIDKARMGDTDARNRVRMCVSTDSFERKNKYAFTISVPIERDDDGSLIQFNQTLQENTVNSVKHIKNPWLRSRARGPEALNGLRLQTYADRGLLRGKQLTTISLIPEQMSDEEAEDAGFFIRNRSLVMQVVSENEDSSLTMKSIFIAGREGPGSEAFDKAAAVEFARLLSVSYEGMTTEEILAAPLLMSNEGGTAAITKLFDQAIYNLTGKYTFYGKETDRPPTLQDYQRKEAEDDKAVKNASAVNERIVDKLVASRPKTAVEATHKLAVLNEAELKKSIIYDDTIDEHVLGLQVAYQVQHARYLYQTNPANIHDIALLQKYIDKNGISSSCPGGAKTETSIESIDGINQPENTKSERVEDCEFISRSCPYCGDKNVKTTCKDGVYYGSCGCDSKKGKRSADDVKSEEVKHHEAKTKKQEEDKLFKHIMKTGGPINSTERAHEN